MEEGSNRNWCQPKWTLGLFRTFNFHFTVVTEIIYGTVKVNQFIKDGMWVIMRHC